MEDTSMRNYTNSSVDYDLMDELLSDGCWLETIGGSDLLQADTSNANALFSPSPFFWPTSDMNYSSLNTNQPEESPEEEKETSVNPNDPNTFENQSVNQNTDVIAEYSGRSEYHPTEELSHSNRSWWIAPGRSPGPFSSVRERLFQAIGYIKDTLGTGEALIQIWVPVNKGSKQVLVTDDQPYSLNPNCHKLANYRYASTSYEFEVEEDSNVASGLPARVFKEKVPEWSPDVRLFNKDEYPRIGYAQQFDVRGTVAVPIFETGNRSCLGVLEVVMTNQHISYHSELEKVCKGLEAVDLSSSELPARPCGKAHNNSCQAVLPELREVLKAVCEAHRLPLAQIWVPCIQQGKEGCRHSDKNYARCISPMDSACYVTAPFRDFHEACSEHHLFRGEGVAGRAFTTNQPCFSSDVSIFSRKEYPLIHYARMFSLRAAVAIRLRNIYDGTVDYVLEFFLPVDCQDTKEQMMMLDSLSTLIQRTCQNFRVITDKELEEEKISLISEVLNPSDQVDPVEENTSAPAPSKDSFNASWISSRMETQQKSKTIQEDHTSQGYQSRSQFIKPEEEFHHDSNVQNKIGFNIDSSLGEHSFPSVGKPIERKRTKVEKTISLQVLRQYFAGSLKDAAKSIGVCPTTLKRICRQHGIKRWPSRKIKKVGHSLRKLQVVIDSVQGAEGAFKIGSLYANFPELKSPNLSGSSLFSTSTERDQLKSLRTPPEATIIQSSERVFSPQGSASRSPTSSCSQSSNSSPSCSSDKQQRPPIAPFHGSEGVVISEKVRGPLNRARSDAELHCTVQEEPKLLERCSSHQFFSEHHGIENPPPFVKSPLSPEKIALRAKVTYGEEKVRFSMQTTWGFKDLQQEISKRFHIHDMNTVDLKYLDDDSEWILLTCDADVEECIDVYKSSRTQTIKLSVHPASQQKLGSSLGSTAPS